MLKQKKNATRPSDVNQLAHHLVKASTSGESDDIALPSPAQVSLLMAELGRKGGKIGGKRRMETMSAKERKDVARKAAAARWSSKNG
jgi:hypothetical protein